MTELQRPPPEDILSAYNCVFSGGLPRAKLKDAAVDGHLHAVISDGTTSNTIPTGTNVVGRSIAWKVFLIPQPPLTSGLPASPASPLTTLRESRKEYVRLLKEKMRAPDGSYEAGFAIPGEDSILPTTNPEDEGNWARNNPLSLDDENPWQEWFAAVDLRRTIAQDVERTFPEIAYFRKPEVQAALTTVLYIWSVAHPTIGYRQGMHELLAPLFYVVAYDSLEPSASLRHISQDAVDFCDQTWVAADSWILFTILMEGACDWYEWQEPPVMQPLNGPMQTHTYVPPVIRVCHTIQSEYLRTVDPSLYGKLQEGGVEPQLYGIRWLRLLFSREFGMVEILTLWDGIFAVDPSLEIAKWICVAMLVRIRNELISSDYSGQLTALLRYPPPPPQSASAVIPHTSLLLRQALNIKASPTPSTGVTLMMENRDILGIPAEVPEPPPQLRRGHAARGGIRGGRMGASTFDHRRDGGSISDLIANRLLDANSAVFSTVSELRRNLPELNFNEISSSLLRGQEQEPESTAFPYQAMARRAAQKSWYDPNPTTPGPKDDPSLRSTHLKLSKAMDWSLEILQNEGSAELERQRAFDCLFYVKALLQNGEFDLLDETRLHKELEGIPLDTPAVVSTASAETSVHSSRANTPSIVSPTLRPSSRPSPFSRHNSGHNPSVASSARSTHPHGANSLSISSTPPPDTMQRATHGRSPSQPVTAIRRPSPISPTSATIVEGRASVSFDPLGALK